MMKSTSKLFIFFAVLFAFCGTSFAQTCTEPGSIIQVKNRSAGKFEYVIFNFKKSPGGSQPDFEVKTSSPPFTDYSGEETYQIAGDKFKSIVFKSVNWMCETQERYVLPKTAIKGIKMLSSFEGIVEFAVGFRSRSRYVATYSYDAGALNKVVMKFRK